MHANCHWLVLLTLYGDWVLGRDPITSVTLMLPLRSLLRGMRVTYVIETLHVFRFFLSVQTVVTFVRISTPSMSEVVTRQTCVR